MHACLHSQEQIHMHHCIKDMDVEEHVCTTSQMQLLCVGVYIILLSSLCGLSLRSVLLLQTIVTVLLPKYPHLYFLYLIGWDDHAQQQGTYITYITKHFQYFIYTCSFNFMQYIVKAAL